MDINVTLPVLNFGPLSVLPEYQRQGVGKALVQAMIKKAKRLDYGAILFFGRPEYYPRFGFQEAAICLTPPNGMQGCFGGIASGKISKKIHKSFVALAEIK